MARGTECTPTTGEYWMSTSIRLNLAHRNNARAAGISISRFVNDAFDVYFDLYPLTQPTREDLEAVAKGVHERGAERERVLEAEHEEAERRRRLEAETRLEAIIRQAENELAALRTDDTHAVEESTESGGLPA